MRIARALSLPLLSACLVSGGCTWTSKPPAVLTSLAVTPVGPAITVGATQQFAAIAKFKDGSSKDITSSVTWSSSDNHIASISGSGLATGIAAGITTISATSASVTGSTALDVTSANFNNSLLNGDYAFTVTALDSRGPAFFAGTIQADGKGNLTGVEDANTAAGVATDVALTGTYNVFADGRGSMTVNASGGLASHTFRFILESNATIGRLIEFDSISTSSGTFEKQDPAAFNAGAVLGNYVFRLGGLDSSANRIAEIGVFSADGAGSISNGLEDVNDNGVGSSSVSVSGTYAVAANSRGTAMLSTSMGSANFAIYVVSANKANFIEIDSTPATVLAGTAEKQPSQGFSNASLSGGYVFLLEHTTSQNLGEFDKAGQLTLDGAGHITSGVQDEDFGNLLVNVTGGTYAVAANGRGTLQQETSAGGRSYTYYMLSPSKLFMLQEGSSSIAFGVAELQQRTAFSNASLAGAYAFSASELGETQTEISVQMLADGTGNVHGLGDASVDGAQSSTVLNGTYQVAANGRSVVTLAQPVGAEGFIFYMISPSRAVVVGIKPDADGTVQLQ
jgi:Bacterial Ig-like domain (group 2)